MRQYKQEIKMFIGYNSRGNPHPRTHFLSYFIQSQSRSNNTERVKSKRLKAFVFMYHDYTAKAADEFYVA